MMIVTAKLWESMNVSWNLNIVSGPKGVMTCGKCSGTSTNRLPLTNYPVIPCPYCGTLNKIPVVYE